MLVSLSKAGFRAVLLSFEPLLLVVEDIHAAYDELKKNGVEISEVQKMDWGAWHCYFEDPDGNKWQLQQKPSL